MNKYKTKFKTQNACFKTSLTCKNARLEVKI